MSINFVLNIHKLIVLINLQNLWSEPGYSFDVGRPSKDTEKPTDSYSETTFKPYENIDSNNKNPNENKPLIIDNVLNENLDDIYVNVHNNNPRVMIMGHEEDKASVINDKNENTGKSYQHKENPKDTRKKAKHGHKDNINNDPKEIGDGNKGQVSANVWEDLLKNVSRLNIHSISVVFHFI